MGGGGGEGAAVPEPWFPGRIQGLADHGRAPLERSCGSPSLSQAPLSALPCAAFTLPSLPNCCSWSLTAAPLGTAGIEQPAAPAGETDAWGVGWMTHKRPDIFLFLLFRLLSCELMSVPLCPRPRAAFFAPTLSSYVPPPPPARQETSSELWAIQEVVQALMARYLRPAFT